MTRGQWKAINDFCDGIGYERQELLQILKDNGTLDRKARLEDLGEYVSGKTYDDMMKFLEHNV